jgi:hypothetical protein
MDKQVATTGPIATANRIVPNPKVPPRITPMISTETSSVILTLPIGTPVTLCRPVIHPSLGPGPRFEVRYIELPIPTRIIPEEAMRIEPKKLSG